MNQTIFEGIRGDNENFIVLLYDFDLCQNSAHVKLHSSKAEQCVSSITIFVNSKVSTTKQCWALRE